MLKENRPRNMNFLTKCSYLLSDSECVKVGNSHTYYYPNLFLPFCLLFRSNALFWMQWRSAAQAMTVIVTNTRRICTELFQKESVIKGKKILTNCVRKEWAKEIKELMSLKLRTKKELYQIWGKLIIHEKCSNTNQFKLYGKKPQKLRMTRSRISDSFNWENLVSIEIKGKKSSTF